MTEHFDVNEDLPRNCTFEPKDWHILARHWYPIALCRDIGGTPVAAKLLDETLVIYRSGNQIVVANDICPHRGVPLSMGSADGESIICAYHGLRFGAGGRCHHVPAHPDMHIPEKLHLRTYPVVERYGLVWTRLRPASTEDVDGTADTTIADMPHWDDPDFQQIVCPTIDIFGFAGRQIEGFLDVAHFGFVHTATFGDANNTVVPPYVPKFNPAGFEVEYRSSVGNYPIGISDHGRPGFEWLRHFRMHLPFTATLTVHFPGEARLVIMNAASPVSAKVTRLFAPIARNFDRGLPIQDVYDFNRRVFEEDKAIVEAQKPECLPLDPLLEAHIPADRSSIAYRRGLRDLGLSRLFIS
ncbi:MULTISPECIES: aromatic ring-hydroxylating oxygenase subunit alpha [unclassified Rhizobium]|uniref:aromatic ring-hydroxylating oxygenase subunit alpha n=1 Tax=unclassified Rhizobium TaxID=2613769 RepID=UPI001AD9F7DA|nr:MULTISPECIES: aromatic ring-hydroxylating dioxygenase subunit alpha [unclassified Rhizobium]MBO9101130.1 aromatic ring-hydroxylating dioxygenase subunit alpha [Rhizobium sp. L58/93]MBO9168394.1 aromatic ring-hydroxylating dioxygenase subunit alpha [Rhizobium sp. L245/93]QXZ88195.1 aromatic ring-hydroxylating dioxygenase subunit alpha [Rhizobium sp. K1/93]QXZ94369.1 aromatic ring-hydroxylating dioxygenase subunit alpha [Rhizobium sp. K15/93]QYA05737.1 aromatic ring-hydroxylating dioxygenase 